MKMTFNINHNYQIKKHNHHHQEKQITRMFEIFVCLLIRLIFLLQTVFSTYFLISFYNQLLYLFVGILIFGIIIDCIYVSVYRHGKEYTW